VGPAKLQPALLAGVAIGVLSALPVVNWVNLCCCGWVLFGGALAAYLMQQNHPVPIETGDGAIVGLLAGVFGAIVATVLSIPIALAIGVSPGQMFDRALETARDMPPEARAVLEFLSGGAGIGVLFAVNAVVMLIVGSIVGMIGGALGTILFRRNIPPQPPGPPPIPTVPTV
jgi:Family of unknown function (DUF5518)